MTGSFMAWEGRVRTTYIERWRVLHMGEINRGECGWMEVSQSSVVHLLPEYDALQVERVLYDPSGWDSNPKNVLLGGQITRFCNTIQIT